MKSIADGLRSPNAPSRKALIVRIPPIDEDPAAVAQAKDVADLEGYSILACGIGSLTQALGGDRAGAEAGTQKILAEAKRVKLADMLTANPQDVEQRVKEGFLALPSVFIGGTARTSPPCPGCGRPSPS